MKIVTNRCYGGFGLSHEAMVAYAKRKGLTLHWYWRDYETNEWHADDTPTEKAFIVIYGTEAPVFKAESEHWLDRYHFPEGTYMNDHDMERDDPDLIAVVEELGDRADGRYSNLEVTEIPDGVEWEISEYDGYETVEEVHRSW
jgi:hypothetical protein